MKMIEHETTTIVVSDLDKYYDALDKALLRYHGMKIGDINKIIRELWSLTYKGQGELHVRFCVCVSVCVAVISLSLFQLISAHNQITKMPYCCLTPSRSWVDISNIEIQSGQDSGSRANRSYNYRIVMSKGNTQMDMRGRCSAVSYHI